MQTKNTVRMRSAKDAIRMSINKHLESQILHRNRFYLAFKKIWNEIRWLCFVEIEHNNTNELRVCHTHFQPKFIMTIFAYLNIFTCSLDNLESCTTHKKYSVRRWSCAGSPWFLFVGETKKQLEWEFMRGCALSVLSYLLLQDAISVTSSRTMLICRCPKFLEVEKKWYRIQAQNRVLHFQLNFEFGALIWCILCIKISSFWCFVG